MTQLQIILVQVNKIRAAKKLVLYFRFIETSARAISECKGQFELLPESSQTSLLNIAFAGESIDIKELREFSWKVKEYFRLSPAFYTMFANHVMVDPDLKKHCEIVKLQRGSQKEIAEYYISYMDRMGKEADPKVKEKLQKNQYDANMYQMNPNNAGMPNLGGGPFNYNLGGGYQPQFPQQQQQNNGNPFGGAQPNRPPPGGTPFGGNNENGGVFYNPFTPQQPGAYQGAQQPAYGHVQGGFQHNAQTGTPQPPQGYNQQQQVYNPFTNQQNGGVEYAKPPQPTPYNPNQNFGYGQQPNQNGNQFDDIFQETNVPKNAGFGGDKKPSAGEHDDFFKQLDDLKKL